MKKHMLFLHYLLKPESHTMIKQVFQALNEDSRKGDLVNLTNIDILDLEIDLNNEEIEGMS